MVQRFYEIRAPDGWAEGVYANGISVWSVETDVTLDFFINLPPEESEDKKAVVIPQQFVAREKLSPRMATYMSLQIA